MISRLFNSRPIRILFKLLNPITYINYFSAPKTADASTSTSSLINKDINLETSQTKSTPSNLNTPEQIQTRSYKGGSLARLENNVITYPLNTQVYNASTQTTPPYPINIQNLITNNNNLIINWDSNSKETLTITILNVPKNATWIISYWPPNVYNHLIVPKIDTSTKIYSIPPHPNYHKIISRQGRVAVRETSPLDAIWKTAHPPVDPSILIPTLDMETTRSNFHPTTDNLESSIPELLNTAITFII